MTIGDNLFGPRVSLKEVLDLYEQCSIDYFLASPAHSGMLANQGPLATSFDDPGWAPPGGARKENHMAWYDSLCDSVCMDVCLSLSVSVCLPSVWSLHTPDI